MRKNNIRIGDIVWVNFHKSGAHVQFGIRPAIVIQNNKGNYYSETIQVVPLTSKTTKSKLPTHVYMPASETGLPKNSFAQCEGARPISKSDIVGYIGKTPKVYMEKISIALLTNIPLMQFVSVENLHKIQAKSTMS